MFGFFPPTEPRLQPLPNPFEEPVVIKPRVTRDVRISASAELETKRGKLDIRADKDGVLLYLDGEARVSLHPTVLSLTHAEAEQLVELIQATRKAREA